jgi:hypothetical protein
MNAVRTLLCLATAAMVLPASSCSTSSNQRQQLITALVQRGDSVLRPADRATAYGAYRFAAHFAPQDTTIAAKLSHRTWTVDRSAISRFAAPHDTATRPQIIAIRDFSVIPNIDSAVDRYLAVAGPRTEGAFPVASSEMDLVNLRMLLDRRLVGDLSYACRERGADKFLFATYPPDDSAKVGTPEKLCMFTSEPRVLLSEVRQIYGKPSVEGEAVVTYGILRLAADANGQVRLVLFPPFSSR